MFWEESGVQHACSRGLPARHLGPVEYVSTCPVLAFSGIVYDRFDTHSS